MRLSDQPRLTLGGRAAELMAFVAGGLGLHQGNRGLLALSMALILALGWSFFRSRSLLQRLEVVVRRPTTARAYEPSPVQVTITGATAGEGVLVSDPSRPKLGVSLLTKSIPAVVTINEIFTRRGVVKTAPLRLTQGSPFGLIHATRTIPATHELLILPALGKASPNAIIELLGSPNDPSCGRPRRAEVGDPRAIRELTPGDPPSRIHWRLSARAGHHLVLDFDDKTGGAILLTIAAGRSFPASSDLRRHDLAISFAATLLHQALADAMDVAFWIPALGAQPIEVTRREPLSVAEEALARIEALPPWPSAAQVDDWAIHRSVIIVHPGDEVPPRTGSGAVTISATEAISRGWFHQNWDALA